MNYGLQIIYHVALAHHLFASSSAFQITTIITTFLLQSLSMLTLSNFMDLSGQNRKRRHDTH